MAQYQRQYMEHSWQPLVRLLKQPPPLPPRLAAGAALDKGVRQAVKDHWAAVNKAMEPIMSHQVRAGRWNKPRTRPTAFLESARGSFGAACGGLIRGPIPEWTEVYT